MSKKVFSSLVYNCIIVLYDSLWIPLCVAIKVIIIIINNISHG